MAVKVAEGATVSVVNPDGIELEAKSAADDSDEESKRNIDKRQLYDRRKTPRHQKPKPTTSCCKCAIF